MKVIENEVPGAEALVYAAEACAFFMGKLAEELAPGTLFVEDDYDRIGLMFDVPDRISNKMEEFVKNMFKNDSRLLDLEFKSEPGVFCFCSKKLTFFIEVALMLKRAPEFSQWCQQDKM